MFGNPLITQLNIYFFQEKVLDWGSILREFWLPALKNNDLIPKNIELTLNLSEPFDIEYR